MSCITCMTQGHVERRLLFRTPTTLYNGSYYCRRHLMRERLLEAYDKTKRQKRETNSIRTNTLHDNDKKTISTGDSVIMCVTCWRERDFLSIQLFGELHPCTVCDGVDLSSIKTVVVS